jgi:sugar/nucleoside kinase (ribokinase family)
VQRSGRTGAIVVLVDAVGERTMITDRGAAAELDAIDPTWLTGARWIHLPLYGFAQPRSRMVLEDAVADASARGIRVSLDLSSVQTLRTLGADVLAEVLERVRPDVVFANEDEARAAAELGLSPAADGVYVIKRGPDPVIVEANGSRAEVPVERVDDVLDSTGAGDAFAAGFITAALDGADAQTCARAGSVLAMSALRRAGAL